MRFGASRGLDMKFAFKFSMPKWERPKQEAPYRPSPIISELENIDFASLTAERRQDVLHRLKLACADIAEDRRHQPAILTDRIRLQKMWQDYFKIAQTSPAGDNQGESLSVSHYSEMDEEDPKPKALGAVMTMQEELVAAANFKIDLGGLDMNDLDDYDDFSPTSIPRTVPPPPPAAHAPARTHELARPLEPRPESHTADKPEKPAEPDAPKRSAADEELAEQMAKIKAVQPMALPRLDFPTEPLSISGGSEATNADEGLLVIEDSGSSLPQAAHPADEALVFTASEHSHEDELAEQMAKIKAVQPMALPPMAFPTDPDSDALDIGHEDHAPDVLVISEPHDDQPLVTPDQAEASNPKAELAKSPDEELAEQMARIKAVKPLSLPPIPAPADGLQAAEPVHLATPALVTPPAGSLTINPTEPQAESATILAEDDSAGKPVKALTVEAPTDPSGFKPMVLPTAKTEQPTDPVQQAETSEAEDIQHQHTPAQNVTVQDVTAQNVIVQDAGVDEIAAQDAMVQNTVALQSTIQSAAEEPPAPKAKKTKKSALASLRSILSSKSDASETSEPATAEAVTVSSASGDMAPDDPTGNELAAIAPVVADPEPEPTAPPKEREVSATPSTKEWVNIKLLRPSVIRGLPLPDQVITIVPYSEAKRLEENGSAIILTKPRTPRGS